MLDQPRIVQTEARLAAVIRLTIPLTQMQSVMGPAIAEVMAAVAAQGIAPAGPVFAHHLRMPSDTFDFEVGVPVMKPVSVTGRVKAGRLPAASVARTVYQGPYEGLPSAWGEFMEWIAAEGHKPAPDFWESYVVHPDSNPEPSAWRTELNRPLAR